MGGLNGATIVRFTHACREGGGLEQYLADLNQALLRRNSLTIIELYLPEAESQSSTTTETIGKGVLVRIPMTARRFAGPSSTGRWPLETSAVFLKNFFRDFVLYHPLAPDRFRKIFIKKNYRRYDREPLDAADKIKDVLEKHKASLLILHLAGGFGGAEAIRMSQNYEVPYLICNHFSNVWFKRVGLREQVAGAAGVGGVSSRDVPKYLKSIFVNLLDGINAEFFSKAVLPKEEDREEDFIITLPARICEGKGHTDIILAADKLNKIGYIFKIFFAGREDSSSYKVFLQKRIDQLNLGKIINFTDHLNRVQLRDLYAKSSVVVMPTYGEGLGRVLLEAQSMELPVIAYNTGGVPDAVLPGKTGYLVKKGDAEQLADRIETLMKDKEKRIKMGQEGRKLIMEKFSLTRLAERHENWYLRAMRRKENPA